MNWVTVICCRNEYFGVNYWSRAAEKALISVLTLDYRRFSGYIYVEDTWQPDEPAMTFDAAAAFLLEDRSTEYLGETADYIPATEILAALQLRSNQASAETKKEEYTMNWVTVICCRNERVGVIYRSSAEAEKVLIDILGLDYRRFSGYIYPESSQQPEEITILSGTEAALFLENLSAEPLGEPAEYIPAPAILAALQKPVLSRVRRPMRKL